MQMGFGPNSHSEKRIARDKVGYGDSNEIRVNRQVMAPRCVRSFLISAYPREVEHDLY